MTPEFLFSTANTIAIIGWIVLIAGIVLKRPLLRDRFAGLYVPLLLAASYTVLILVFWWGTNGGFDTLANVQKLFTSPWAALAGWVHYLAYDLFIGALVSRWIMERGISRLFLIPILPLAFLFGPIGFLVSRLVLRFGKGDAA
jgi:Domain of unknown function (DUF4281)